MILMMIMMMMVIVMMMMVASWNLHWQMQIRLYYRGPARPLKPRKAPQSFCYATGTLQVSYSWV